MKKKRTVRLRVKKRNSTPFFFLILITLVVVAMAVYLIRLNQPRELGYSGTNPQVLGASQVSGFFGFIQSLFLKNSSSSTKPSPVQKTELPKTTGNRVVGNAGEFYPYGKIDESTIVVMPVIGKGGVIEATLSANIRFYLVYPSNLPEGTPFTLTPYYSMPTAKDAVALSTELGYGLDIQYEGSRHGELPAPMYAVFDLDNGKTISQIRKDTKTKYFCDPTSSTFNPEACALINKVPLSEHTNRQYAVISPIRTEGLTNLASMEPTVPIGYENLIVVPLIKETTLIPQKLSKELLADLIKGNGLSSQTNIYRTEAITHAIENNLYTPENLDGILSRYYGSTQYEDIKLYYELPKLSAFYAKIKAGKNLNTTEKAFAEALSGSNYDFHSDIQDNLKDLRRTVITQFSDHNAPEHYITGGALIRRLEKEGMDMTREKTFFVNMLKEDWDYYMEQDDPSHLSMLLITAVMLSPKYLAQNGFNLGVISPVFAEEGANLTPEQIQEALDNYIRLAKREMNRLCGKDTYVSPSSIERGLKFAQMIGDEEGANMCMNKMCANLDEALKDPQLGFAQEEAKNWILYQKWCDDSSEKNDQWRDRVLKGNTKLICTTLIKKNLRNFGNNKIDCTEVMDENGTIDGYKFDIEVTKQTLRNKGETAPLDRDPGPGYSPSAVGN